MPRDVLATLQKLPAECLTVLRSNPKQLIGIHRGVPGYTPLRECVSEAAAREMATRMNDERGVSDAQLKAMEAGSMFGWHVPGADPDTWTKPIILE